MFFDQLRILQREGLPGSTELLACFLTSINESCPSTEDQTMLHELYIAQADSMYENGVYKQAEGLYQKALQMQLQKASSRARGSKSDSNGCLDKDITSDIVVKYKVYLCNIGLDRKDEAKTTLESIPAKQRTAKVNMALAKIYHKEGSERCAITSYKEVLRQCPLALEAALGLLNLGVTGAEVASLVMNGISDSQENLEWLSQWIKAHAFTTTKDYTKAADTLASLDTKGPLRNNTITLLSMAEFQFLAGNYTNAKNTYQRVRVLDSLVVKGMDMYSWILAKENNVKELEKLANSLMQVTDKRPEPWIVMAQYCIATKRCTRAIYLAQKAYTLDNYNVQAVIVKGFALMELNKIQEAINHFREAFRLAPHRFEPHQGLVDCYIVAGKLREAFTTAKNCVKTLGAVPQTLTVLAVVLAKDPTGSTHEKAKALMDKALSIDPYYLQAVYVKADIMIQNQDYDEAIELLRNQLIHQSTGQLHRKLGDCLAATNDFQNSLDQYKIAVSMDANDSKAQEGLERVEKASSSLDMSPTDEDDFEQLGDSVDEMSGEISGSEWVNNQFSMSSR